MDHASTPRWRVAALLLSFALAPTALKAQNTDISDAANASADETPRVWFVELASEPSIEGTSATALDAEKRAFRRSAQDARVKYRERYSYGKLWNGLSVEVEPGEVTRIARLAGVKAVYPVVTFAPPEASSNPGTELATALQMTGADVAQNSLGLTGRGVKVAVMDTGIDYDHPDLGGCFGPSCRVATGWDFVGDDFNADDTSASYNPVTVPDPFPDDCNGHGTHVAGIVGANGAIRGVAPNVTFGAYRVFGCEGSTTAEIMIAAMERAYDDGMDILNMSIGSAFQWPQYPTAVAASRLVKKGMVVVASIGNSGTNGLYAAGAPGLGKDVIGVASFDNTHVLLTAFTVSPDNTAIGYVNSTAAPQAPETGSLPMAKTGNPTVANDGCTASAPGSFTGMAVLIRRGTCGFHDKARNAQAAGAAAVVLYNNTSGFINPTVAGPVAITIPVVAITAAEGALIDSRLNSGPVTMTWTSSQVSVQNPSGRLISSFSSYGLSPDLTLKPDIGAPGGNINSTYPLEAGGNANISGTSMASPHVAGAAALLLQSNPKTKASSVRDIFQNSADPRPWWGAPSAGFLDNVHRQGAGMLDIDDSILSTTSVTPAKLSLGESEQGQAVEWLTIRNNANFPVTYDTSYVNALTTTGTITPGFWLSDATVAFSQASVTVPARGTATLQVTINPASEPDPQTAPTFGQYGGYIVLTPTDGGQVYRVPFAGFIGDYQGILALSPTANGFPWLAKLGAGGYTNQPTGATYTLQGDDIPFFLVHFEHQVQRFLMEVHELKTGKDGVRRKGRSWHKILDESYMGRNSTATSFFAFSWDGETFKGKGQKTSTVPNGEYVVTISALKALGDERNPEHTETWESPVVTIARP